jgi:pimeloyl-ACP methyl ester carboxylesterase
LGALDDQIMPIWFAQDAAGRVAGAKLVELTHGGHMFPETRTEEFLAAVLPFLKH